MATTLITVVQDIMSDLTSDEVNSISDTTEAMQVANIVKGIYEHHTTTREWESFKKLGSFDSLGDSDLPCIMLIPSRVTEIYWVKYDKREDGDTRSKYLPVEYLDPKLFLEKANALDDNSSDVDTMTHPDSLVPINVWNNQAPMYWTTFDQKYVVFDAYDSDVDDTIQNSKLQVYYYKLPDVMSLADDTEIDLPEDCMNLVISDAKSKAWFVIKEVPNQDEAARARRQLVWNASKHSKQHANEEINYGRK